MSMQPLPFENFLVKARGVHGDRYKYDESTYRGYNHHITITCRDHGVFKQYAGLHAKGGGCSKCAYVARHLPFKKFVSRSNKIHNNKYNYPKNGYIKINAKARITCPKHGDFMQSADVHYRGQGCPQCSNTGFNPSIPAILYYLRVETRTHTLYKIGITNKTVQQRFLGDLSIVTSLQEIFYAKGANAYDEEQRLLKKYAKYRYTGIDRVLRSAGNSELFTRDVLGKDH